VPVPSGREAFRGRSVLSVDAGVLKLDCHPIVRWLSRAFSRRLRAHRSWILAACLPRMDGDASEWPGHRDIRPLSPRL
jgi:hypothetical protein